jgi:hypothetical protein
MKQGYHIAVTNSVAMLGLSKENTLLRALSSAKDDTDLQLEACLPTASFRNAECLSKSKLETVLQRIGDPNVHVTLVFLHHMSCYPGAMRLFDSNFPWESLSLMLNTLLPPKPSRRLETDDFPVPEKVEVRPFPEDFAMRGLNWAENYYPSA